MSTCRALVVIVVTSLVAGCCWFCKQPPVTPQVVTVPVTCKLPEGPGPLPAPQRAGTCPKDHVCFDVVNTARLAERDGKMKLWIREVKAKCSASDAGVGDAAKD